MIREELGKKFQLAYEVLYFGPTSTFDRQKPKANRSKYEY